VLEELPYSASIEQRVPVKTDVKRKEDRTENEGDENHHRRCDENPARAAILAHDRAHPSPRTTRCRRR